MAQGGKGKKLASFLEKKDVANTGRTAIRREAEESNVMMARMEAMDNHELREYMSQKKGTQHESQMKATIKKLLKKDKPKKKKRTIMSPILGATMKFHKDDDIDPAAAATVGAAA
ncbi:unnamed protein product [Urochloa decumbens]|uniref:Uncharacterized protein n=1 Tax=Urochloa decumbens TaxID=240449 RepID=A0ABC9H0J9_9POAL